MSQTSAEELREALTGTLRGVARLAELLVDRKIVSPDQLKSFLSAGEHTASGRHRRDSIAGLRRLLERGPDRNLPATQTPPSRALLDELQNSDDFAERQSQIKQKMQAELTAYYAMLSAMHD
jgi:hypothetical protein